MKALLCALLLCAAIPAARAEDEPASFVRFVEEPTGACVSRDGVQIQLRNAHPTRTLRVWLDRYQSGVGTGDRSRAELAPGAQAQPLGCSRNLAGVQEWRLARAVFVD